MRIVFVLLVALNLIVLAAWKGWLGPVLPGQTREPARLEAQLQAERLKVLSEAELEKAVSGAASKARTQDAAARAACLEWGGFDADALARARAALPSEDLNAAGARIDTAERTVGAEYAVIMGPYVDRPTTERKMVELRGLKVTDMAMTEDVRGRWISLGLFDVEANAKRRLDALSTQGVRTARIERRTGQTRSYLQVRDAPAPLAEKLRQITLPASTAAWGACR
ncbi:hypothetical protein IP84_14015 [beta proteobacterium AAP99]|nr:hypothetical protein IP84_14015 [beta proteobacterium AAP99]